EQHRKKHQVYVILDPAGLRPPKDVAQPGGGLPDQAHRPVHYSEINPSGYRSQFPSRNAEAVHRSVYHIRIKHFGCSSKLDERIDENNLVGAIEIPLVKR